MTTKTVEETYIKKEQKQHIKDCPDSYVGSIEKTSVNLWTFDEETSQIVRKDIEIVPALYKIFDEILVNAYDQYIRSKIVGSPGEPVTIIKVNVDVEKNEISIYNNGSGIPVVVHKEYKKYIPELIFGELLTSSNYDKSEKKITGGKNGFGAKTANIFSTSFTVETVDNVNNLKFIQEFKKNMDIAGKPKITKSVSKPYVKVTFCPDFQLLGMGEVTYLEPDIVNLFKRRVYDMTACTDSSVTIYWNEEKINCKAFDKYVEMYIGPKTQTPRVHEIVSDRWELIVCPSNDNNLEHVSFVNGIYTYRGGEHVDYVANQVARKLNNYLKKKKGNNIVLKESHIKDNMMIFLKCSIENPSFSSQTKEYMTTVLKNFGSKCNVSDAFIEKVSKLGIVEKAQKLGEFKDSFNLDKAMANNSSKRLRIPKYEAANWAGGPKSRECILILTEGDSAKSSVEAGFNVVSRDRFGIFPLKGKLLNVREAKQDQLMNNEEIKHIREIMGLQFYKKGTKEKMTYDETLKGLNYGKIMIMCDQDTDGYHIKGLLINYIEYFWPSLIQIKGFLTSFKTPIVVATKKTGGHEKVAFFNLTNYENWKEEVESSQWNIKYYKGLGTSSRTDFQTYFQNYDKHYIEFFDSEQKATNCIELAFAKQRADDRKDWIGNFDKEIVVDPSVSQLSYEDFFNKELIHFSVYDCERSIPNICDGLKPSQRKIIYSLLKRRSKQEIKVSQLSGVVAGETDYHHGEVSLMGCIINMAQDHIGSNNINLLVPEGQFGSRRMGGKDNASPRYIYTYLSPIARALFHDDDMPLLSYLEDDKSNQIEPTWFLPILPMILINGSEGIGTGYSTFIPSHNPLDVVANIRRMLKKEDPIEMAPWWRGFTGQVKKEDDKYYTHGRIESIASNVFQITELPVGCWTENYQEYLDNLILDKGEKNLNKKNKQCLIDFENNSTDTKVDFKVKFSPSKMTTVGKSLDKIKTVLKLSSSDCTKDTNMHLFNAEQKMTKYDTILDILKEFFQIRLVYYQKRKDTLLGKYQRELDIIKEKIRFIEFFIDKKLLLINQTDTVIVQSLEEHQFLKFNDIGDSTATESTATESTTTESTATDSTATDVTATDVDENDADEDVLVKRAMKDYNYLIGMSIRTLTKKKIEELKKQRAVREVLFEEINNKTNKQLWSDDLDKFVEIYEKTMADWVERMSTLETSATKSTKEKIKKTLKIKKV